jgi:hypothetical protein
MCVCVCIQEMQKTRMEEMEEMVEMEEMAKMEEMAAKLSLVQVYTFEFIGLCGVHTYTHSHTHKGVPYVYTYT